MAEASSTIPGGSCPTANPSIPSVSHRLRPPPPRLSTTAEASSTTGPRLEVTYTVPNSPPIATRLNTSETFTEDQTLNLSDIVVSDADDLTTTATLTLSNPAAGTLSTATSGSVTSTYNGITGVWQASGSINDVNNLQYF